MKYNHKYFEHSRCLLRVWNGSVTGKDVEDAELAMNHLIDEGKQISGVLVDLSNTSNYDVSYGDALKIAQASKAVSEGLPGLFFALVAPRPLLFGMSKVWEALCYDIGWTIDVFYNISEAESWLGNKLGVDSIYV